MIRGQKPKTAFKGSAMLLGSIQVLFMLSQTELGEPERRRYDEGVPCCE